MLKMYIMGRHFNNRGVSQVVAALLLIAISVAAAILLYVFAIGLLGSLGTSGGSQTKEELILEAYSFPNLAGPVAIAMRDVGPSSINIGGADFFVNGVKATLSAGVGTSCVGLTLTPSESCGGSLTLGTMSSLVTGASYPLRVVTPDGGVFSYPITAGGSS
jgi:hypothetical protein